MGKAPNNYERSKQEHSNEINEVRAQASLARLHTILGDRLYKEWWAATFEQEGGNAERFTWLQIRKAAHEKYESLPAHIHDAHDAWQNATFALGNYVYSVSVHIYKQDDEKEAELRKALETAEAQYLAVCDQYQSTFECACNGANRSACACCAHTGENA